MYVLMIKALTSSSRDALTLEADGVICKCHTP